MFAVAGFGAALFSATAAAAPDLSGKTDDSIRQVLLVVSNHQIDDAARAFGGKLADGDYTPVSTVEALKAARQPKGISWSYPWGVTLYGVIRAGDFLEDKSAQKFALEHNQVVARSYAFYADAKTKLGLGEAEWRTILRDGMKVRFGPLISLGHLDSCGAMGVQILEGMLKHPESVIPEQKAVVERVADWVVNRQERLPDDSPWPGTFWRPNSADGDRDHPAVWPKGTIWIDDLYMGGTFLVRYYQYTGEGKYLDDAARQVIHMASMVQDTDGVWFHGFSIPLQKRSPIKWGRANGWAMVSTVEVLSAMKDDNPLRPLVLGVLRRHIEGIKALQAPSGMWRQILNDPELWEETSCTAMFGYSIARAVNRGWIAPENMAVARKAFEAICAKYITPDGQVNGTCRGTNIAQVADYYRDRPHPDDELHGRGVVLLLGAEILAAGKSAK